MGKKNGQKLLVRVSIALVVLILVSYGGVRGYLVYEVHCAADLLRELASVKIGQPEAVALAVSQRYGGYGWKSTDKRDFYGADHVYAVEVNPWRYGNVMGHTRRFDATIRAIVERIPPRWRLRLGFREWLVGGGFGITDGRIILVQGMMIAEGNDRWLGGGWNLMTEVPENRRRPGMENYAVHRAHMLWEDEGSFIDTYITPTASLSDAQNGRRLNLRCLSPRSSCTELSDLMPEAVEYYNSYFHEP